MQPREEDLSVCGNPIPQVSVFHLESDGATFPCLETHTHTQGRNGPIRLSPTEHPNGDPNPKKIAHSVFTYQTQTPTDDPNRAPIFGTGQAGTQICVLSLHDAFSGQASGWSRRGELSSRRGAAGGVDPCSGNGGGGRPPAEHRGTRAAAGAAPALRRAALAPPPEQQQLSARTRSSRRRRAAAAARGSRSGEQPGGVIRGGEQPVEGGSRRRGREICVCSVREDMFWVRDPCTVRHLKPLNESPIWVGLLETVLHPLSQLEIFVFNIFISSRKI